MSSQPLAVSSRGRANGCFSEGNDQRDKSGTSNDMALSLADIRQRNDSAAAKVIDRVGTGSSN